MLLTAILAGLHITFAIAWLGGGIMFGLIVAPGLAKLSPGSSGEFFVKIAPRVIRYFQIVPALTVVFGFALYGSMLQNGGNSDFWSMDILAGMGVALIAFVVSETTAVPPLAKVVRMLKEMQAAGSHTPAPELPATIRRAGTMSLVTLLLLFVTIGFMVAAGFY